MPQLNQVVITSKNYDLLGYLYLDGPGILEEAEERRVSVTRTLDGAVQIDDAGWTPADTVRQFVLEEPTEDQLERARRLVSLHSEHRLYWQGSVYSGTLIDYSYDPPALRLSFQIDAEDV